MKVLPVNFQNNQKTVQKFQTNSVSSPATTEVKTLSNLYYLPSSMLSFKGVRFETQVVKKVLGKQYQGLGIYTPDGNFIDCLKIGIDKLAAEPLDIVKATDNEIAAHRFSFALDEAFRTQWVARYNPENRVSPLAVSHTLNSEDMKEEVFARNLEILYNQRACKSLDIPITDKNGKLSLDAVVFDTETTGTNIKQDKIVQIATVKIKNGQVVKGEDGTFNQLINPEIPIPEEASEVNGITDEMVAEAPTINAMLGKFLGQHLNKQNGIPVVYNSRFDIPLLNKAIREYNVSASTDLKEKSLAKTLDPFILVQRIHPFLGAKKKLGEQYHWLFCKPLEDAHDALADVKGTIDVLKYCLYYLSEHRKDKSVPLTLREVLIFQNGGHGVENIDIPLHPTKNFNSKFTFDQSYRPEPLDLTNYFKGYKLTKKAIDELLPEIGPNNVVKLLGNGIVDEMVGKTFKGHTLQAPETERIPKTKKFKNLSYVMKENFKKVLSFANLEEFNGKTKEELEELITEKSKCYLKDTIKEIWIKNVNPKDIALGNDLPDDTITRRVMKESQE